MSWPVRIAMGAALLLALLLAGVVALVAFFPRDAAVAEIVKQVEKATARELTIGGDVDFSIWPALGFSAADVTLSNPAGYDGAPFLAAEKVVFAVSLLPLISGDVDVRRLHLEKPSLALVARAGGAGNWEFPAAAQSGQAESAELQSLRLSDVRVRDGRLSFHGPDAAPPMIVDSIDADLSLDSLDDPANAKGTLSYLGQILSFDASFAAPRALIAQGETPLALQFKGALVEGELDGSFDARTGAVAGKAQARGTSTRRVLEWLGSPLPPGDGFAAFSARGDYRQDGEGIRLGGARFSMDAIEATGDLLIKTIKGRMAVSGALNAPRLDVNPYMPAPAQAAPGAAGGVNTAQPWSTAPIDLSGLRGADADLTLTIGALAFQKMTFENARLGVRLNDGALDARLSHFAMYGGTGSGRLLANARGPALQLATEMRVNGVQALPFLRDAIGFERIEGAGQLTASFAGEGRAQADIMRSLRGTTSFTFTDGAFKGVNLANVARTVQAALSGQAVGSSAKTDFAELAASFQVADGVAVTQDLRLLNPFVRLDGRGLIDIGAQTLDMRLAPRVVGSIEGQGGEAGLQGIGVPFRAYGPWSAPRFAPDLQDTLRNAVQEQARKALGRSNLGDLGALLGLGAPAQTPTPAATGEDATAPDAPQEAAAEGPAPQSLEDRARERARDALGGLFKRDN